jgi:hypothetical protein
MDRPKPMMDETNCVQAARERSVTILRERARQYHEHAVSLNKLADWAQRLDQEQDEALWRILQGFTPR